MSLVGRARELERAHAALERGLSGKASLVLFAGEAGIGKTSLADAVATTAQELGANVVWGRCWEAGGAPAYWPWLEVFRALGDGDPFTQSVETSPSEAQQARFQKFERAAQMLRAAAEKKPLVLVLDDLHAADVPSLLFLHLVARGLRGGGRLAIVGTYRDAEARLANETFTLLAKIGREAEVIHVGRLGREDVVAWIRHAQPSATDAIAGRVHDVTEGNPLFVHEVLRVHEAIDPAHLPDGLRAILEEHVSRASPELRELLAVASIFGRETTPPDLAALSKREVADVATQMKEARDAGLVVGVPGHPGRHAFAHMLIREHLYAELSPSRRAELHAELGERLARAGDLAGAAHHLFHGPTTPTSRERTAGVARDAAVRAIASLAFEDATSLASRAISVLDDALNDSPLACELETVLAESLIRVGESARGKEAAIRAAEMAKRFGWARPLAQAALVYGAEMATAVVDPVMVGLLRGALATLATEDDAVRARVMARLASSLVPPSQHDEVEEILGLARNAVAMARRVGEPDTLLFALRYAAAALGYLVTSDERTAYARETMELATTLDRPVMVVDMGAMWAGTLRERGHRAESARALDSYLRLIREFPQPHYQWRPPLVLASHAMLDGDFERADRLAGESLEISEGASLFPGFVCWALHRSSTTLLRGDPRSVAGDVERILAIFARLPGSAGSFGIPMGAIVLAAAGRDVEARERLATFKADILNFPMAIMLGRAAVLLGDTALGERLLGPLSVMWRDNPAFWGMHYTSMFGPAAQVAGEVAVMLGRLDEARPLFEEAIAFGERAWSPPIVANARQQLEALGAPPSRKPAPSRGADERPLEIHVHQEGDVWRIRSSAGGEAVLKDAKGLHYLAELVRHPGRELHVTQLADMLEPAGDAGPVLDAKAKDAYRLRLEDLRDQLEEARRFSDPARAERAEAEIDALVEQLAKAVGLGGRDRKMGSHVERARINVQRRLKDVLRRVEEQSPSLGRYLAASIKTGTWCAFSPL